MNHAIVKWEAAGIPFTVLIGLALHYAFAWSGYWPPVALVAAVNESVWEHLKLAFWPSLLWALLEYFVFRLGVQNFWAAKSLALLVAPTVIVITFYGYTSLLGRNVLALDIATFVIAIAIGQLSSALLVKSELKFNWVRSTGGLLLTIQLAAYSSFTFYPPAFGMFEDPRIGIRGIPPVSFRDKNALNPAYADQKTNQSERNRQK
jgi:hypothetical protein